MSTNQYNFDIIKNIFIERRNSMAKNSPKPTNNGYERRDGAQKTTSGKPVRPAPPPSSPTPKK